MAKRITRAVANRVVKKVMADKDMVNHPPHYTSSDAKCSKCKHPIECIDVTRTMEFVQGNAIKYLWRYKDKNGLQDLLKAQWYLNDLIEQMKND